MSTVTFKGQPGMQGALKAGIPLEGTKHLYRVAKVLWPEEVEEVLAGLLLPPSLHVCCGRSQLGDVRFDIDLSTRPTVVGDAARLPFDNESFCSVLCDPPYNGRMQWNHDLLSELSRVSCQRIVFQHWFSCATRDGRYKKAQDRFHLTKLMIWQPRTYFGRVQLVQGYDTAGAALYPGITFSPKECTSCKESKPLSEFYRRRDNGDGFNTKCKSCLAAVHRRYYERHGERIREYRKNYGRVARYGVNSADVERMLSMQGRRCAICRCEIDSNAHVDHDHETGRVRGMLCKGCNIALGLLRDSVENLQTAIEYLSVPTAS